MRETNKWIPISEGGSNLSHLVASDNGHHCSPGLIDN